MSAPRIVRVLFALLLAVLSFGALAAQAQNRTPGTGSFEVWVIDQSDTSPNGGGTLYVYPGPSLIEGTSEPEVIDLGSDAASLCLEQTGSSPSRPHMILFNDSHSHAILSFVATGHVVFFDAATRAPLACIDAGE